jgi:hypothetical protein
MTQANGVPLRAPVFVREFVAVGAVAASVLLSACGDTPLNPSHPNPPVGEDYTGAIEMIDLESRSVLLWMGNAPDADGHLVDWASVTGVGSFDELAGLIRQGHHVQARAHFPQSLGWGGYEITSLDVLQVDEPSKWRWRWPLYSPYSPSPRPEWHGWIMYRTPGKWYLRVAPWTVFDPRSQYRSIEALRALDAGCAEVETFRIKPNWTGFWAASMRVWRLAPGETCSQEVLEWEE